MGISINHTFKEKMMQYQNKVLVGHTESSILDEIPDDAYVIDTRKDLPKFYSSIPPYPIDYAIEYAHLLGYSDDKIYLIYECYLMGDNRAYKKQGSLCDKDADEIIQEYKDLGIELHSEYEKMNGDAE